MNALCRQARNIVWICKPFWKYGKGYILLSICILGLHSPIEDVIYVRFPEIMINLLSAGKPFAFIAGVAAAICGVSFLNNAVQLLARGFFTKKQTQINLMLNRDIYRKAMRLDYKFIDSPRCYDQYAWAVSEYAQQVQQGRDFLVSFSQCVLSLAALSTIIAALGPWILLVEVVQVGLHSAVNRQVNRNDIAQKEAVVPLQRRLDYFHRLFYMKDYAADMRSTSLSGKVFADYYETGNREIAAVGRFAMKRELLNCLHEVIFCTTELGIVLYLARSILSGRIPEVGMYMTLMLSFYRLDCKIDALTYLMKDASSLSMNAEKIRAFFEIQSEIETDQSEPGAVPEQSPFSVELQNVGFSYEESDFSLSGLNVSIKPGEKIAIVGENGAGKSTFVKLLLRLYDVTKGEILIDGKAIRKYDVHALRQRIGVAFQNTNIYAMSFAENVSLYEKAPEQSMRTVTQMLGLDAVLEKNHADCQAELTREFQEDGIMLSGGEAQKIALARVMSGHFGLLLLDEPSSALDPIAEYKMSQAILSAANKVTTIMIAHRLSTVRDADRILVIDHGTIREAGTHDELMALHGKYCEMFTKQAENYVK